MNIALWGTETLPCNVKRERAFTPIIKYHISACNYKFSKTQSRLWSEYTYNSQSASMLPHHLQTKSYSATDYLRRMITTARWTNIRNNLAKTRLTTSFYIHRETPITMGHTITHIKFDVYSWGTTNLLCVTPIERKRKTTISRTSTTRVNNFSNLRSMNKST